MLNWTKILILMLMGAVILFALPSKAAAFDFFGKPCDASNFNEHDPDPAKRKSNICGDVSSTAGHTKQYNSVLKVINTAANILAMITGVYAVIMVMVGGFSIITSGGNAEKVAAGRRRIIYALVGIVVVALAWVITSFIINIVF
jgi:hypothetical protein